MKTFFKKLEYCFLVESAVIENKSFQHKTAIPEANAKNRMESRNEPIAFASNYFIFLEILFQLKNLLKELI